MPTANVTTNWEATETLLSGQRYKPLYRWKEALLRRFSWLSAVFAYNKYYREQWIKAKAREVPVGSRVIDVGAGSCPYRSLFSHCEYVAHDIGKLEDHQLQGRRGYGKLELVSDINAIPVESGSFDVVLCTEVIEHVPEPIKAVAEMGRMLKAGGRLLLSAPLRSALHQMPYHYYAGYTPSWYEKFLAQAGFTDIQVNPICGVFQAYGEATLYLALYLSPFSSASRWARAMFFPFWLISVPWLGLICPVLCSALDHLGMGKEFTLGYQVEAIKSVTPSQQTS